MYLCFTQKCAENLSEYILKGALSLEKKSARSQRNCRSGLQLLSNLNEWLRAKPGIS